MRRGPAILLGCSLACQPFGPTSEGSISLDSGAEAAPATTARPGCFDGSALGISASSDDSDAGLTPACNPNNALVLDGKVAGLDRNDPGGATLIVSDDGATDVSSCLAVDFGAPLSVTSIQVHATAVDNACGVACSSGGCGTQWLLKLFVSGSDRRFE